MRKLGKENIILAESAKLVNFNKMIVLNESAAYLWDAVGDSDFTVEKLAALLTDKYEVDGQTASADAAKVASEWVKSGIVEE